MKIKYRKLDNTVIAMGPCDFVEDAECAVASVEMDIPNDPISDFKFNGSGIEKRSLAEVDAEESPKKNARKKAKRDLVDALVTVTGLTRAKIVQGIKLISEDGNDD